MAPETQPGLQPPLNSGQVSFVYPLYCAVFHLHSCTKPENRNTLGIRNQVLLTRLNVKKLKTRSAPQSFLCQHKQGGRLQNVTQALWLNMEMIYERRVETRRARQATLNEDVAGRDLRELSRP